MPHHLVNAPPPIDKRAIALDLARRGFPVFRLQPNGKKPEAGGHGHLEATTDLETVHMWWTDPLTGSLLDYNIGLRPVAGKWCVIDLDTKHGDDGPAKYRELGGEIGGLVVLTATGGLHVYCAGGDVANSVGELAPGIDTRGADGYVVAPGSTIDGVAYEIISADPMLPVPQFVLDAVPTRAERDRNRTVYTTVEDDQPRNVERFTEACRRALPASAGCWHDMSRDLACEAVRCAVSVGTALEIMREHWVPRGTGFFENGRHERWPADVEGSYAWALAQGEHGAHAVPDPASTFGAVVPPPVEPEPSGAGWGFVDLTTLQGVPLPKREFIVDQWLAPGQVTILYGEGGTGKSLLALQLMTSVATGRPWLGLPVSRCKAMGLFCEDPHDELHRRQADINAAFGLDFSNLADSTWKSAQGEENTFLTFDRDGNAVTSEAFAQFLAAAKRFRARLVVVDTAADTFGGNENDRRQVRQFVGTTLGRLAKELNAAVLLCAHPSRAGRNTGDLDGGSTAWSNTARARWAFARPEGQRGTVDPDERVLSRRKANYATIGDELRVRWTRGLFLPVAPLTIEETRARWARAETVFLRLLNRYTLQGRNVSPHRQATTYAPKVLSEQPDTEGLLRADLEGALDRLMNKGWIRVEEWGPSSHRKPRLVATVHASTTPDFG